MITDQAIREAAKVCGPECFKGVKWSDQAGSMHHTYGRDCALSVTWHGLMISISAPEPSRFWVTIHLRPDQDPWSAVRNREIPWLPVKYWLPHPPVRGRGLPRTRRQFRTFLEDRVAQMAASTLALEARLAQQTCREV